MPPSPSSFTPVTLNVTTPVTFPAPTQVLGHDDFLGPRNEGNSALQWALFALIGAL